MSLPLKASALIHILPSYPYKLSELSSFYKPMTGKCPPKWKGLKVS